MSQSGEMQPQGTSNKGDNHESIILELNGDVPSATSPHTLVEHGSNPAESRSQRWLEDQFGENRTILRTASTIGAANNFASHSPATRAPSSSIPGGDSTPYFRRLESRTNQYKTALRDRSERESDGFGVSEDFSDETEEDDDMSAAPSPVDLEATRDAGDV